MATGGGSPRTSTERKWARNLIPSFRVFELKKLLEVYGKDKYGAKAELVKRCEDLVKGQLDDLMCKRLEYLEAGLKTKGHHFYTINNMPGPDSAAKPRASNSNLDNSINRVASGAAQISRPSLTNAAFSKPSSMIPSYNAGQVPHRMANLGHNHPTSIASSSSSTQFNASSMMEHIERMLALPAQIPLDKGPLSGTMTVTDTLRAPPTLSSFKFSSLPFMEEISELIPPTNMSPTNTVVKEGEFRPTQTCDTVFSLSQDLSDLFSKSLSMVGSRPGSMTMPVMNFSNPIILRVALISTEGNIMTIEDCFPPAFKVIVNDMSCDLPAHMPLKKGQPKDTWMKQYAPIDLSKMVSSHGSNRVLLKWVQPTLQHQSNPNIMDFSKKFCFTVLLVNQLSAEDLIIKVKEKGVKVSEYTQAIIRDKLQSNDDEIATTSLRASLLCPVRSRFEARLTLLTLPTFF